MKGSIQPGLERGKVQTCPACGSEFIQSAPRTRLFCPNHPDIIPSRFRVKFGSICHNHTDFRAAEMELISLNYKRAEGTFDARDYQIKAKPLSFSRLASEWLDIKARHIKASSVNPLRLALERASRVWGQANIKTIQYSHIEDFFNGLEGLSPKSRKHTLDALKQFWGWANDRYGVTSPKKWPRLGFVEMAFRPTVDIPTQEAIISDIKKNEPFKVWLCIKWLATYIAIRPGEMRGLKEAHVDRARGVLIVPHPKERRSKIIPLIPEDIELVRSLPLAFDSSSPFFRHERENGGAHIGRPFGHSVLYGAWSRACGRLGIHGVSLYPGTKHSTAMGLRSVATPEEIKSITLHSTSAAFHRYFQTGGEALRELQGRRQSLISDQPLTKPERPLRRMKVIDFAK